MRRLQKCGSGGFSLVELMVVIAIIALLVALLIPGVGAAIRRVKQAKIKLEVGGLAAAIQRYRDEQGEYPPDFTTGDPVAEINTHLARKFRYRNPKLDVPAAVDLTTLDPMEALYFWLRNFSPDPQRPVSGLGDRTPLFDFDQSRLTDRDGDGHLEYVPPQANEIPYLYYRNRNKAYLEATAWAETYSTSVFPVARPYLSEISAAAAAARANAGMNTEGETPIQFAEAEKFQIISAGLDGEFGLGGGYYPGGNGYTAADRDNIVNFSQGATLEADVP